MVRKQNENIIKMTAETILQDVAREMSARVSEGNPLGNAVFLTVAEPKEGDTLHTFAVLQALPNGARELIPGNFTWHYPCRLYARFYPPQGNWAAEQMLGFFEEAALALVASLSACMQVPRKEKYFLMEAVVTGGISWQAEATGGYEGEIPFRLIAQF